MVVALPPRGWCVRPGAATVHFFTVTGRTSASACGHVQRADFYAPINLRPRQRHKPLCAACCASMAHANGGRRVA